MEEISKLNRFKYFILYGILVIVIMLVTACSSPDEVNKSVVESDKIGIPITISDIDCKGENYQITFKNGETLKYCLPSDAVSAEEFVTAYNKLEIENDSAGLTVTDPKEFYRSAIDVYDDIALKFSQFIAKDKIQDVFIFAEFVSTDEREEQLKEVMSNSIGAFNTSLNSSEVADIVSKLMQEGITPQTHIEFDYKNNFYRVEIDELKAIAVTIRSNEFQGAY